MKLFTTGSASMLSLGIFVLACLLYSCTTTEAAMADKKNYTDDSPEYRKRFDVAYDEGEKPIRYGYYYVVSTVPEGFKVRVFHPDKKTMTEEKIYSTSALTLLHGYYESFWDDGSIREQGTYQFGRKHGIWLENEPGKGKSSSGEYSNHRKEGLWTQLDSNGMVEAVYNWHDGKRHGKFLLYDSSGQKINEGLYRNDTLIAELFKLPKITRPYLKSCNNELVSDIFQCTDNVLKQFVYTELKYPPDAKKNKVQGMAVVQWDVMANGTVQNVRVPQSLSNEIEQEIIRVINRLPAWAPALKDGVPVKATESLPLTFEL